MLKVIKQHKKQFVIALLAVIIIAFILLSKLTGSGNKPVFQTAPVTRGRLVSSVTASGQVITTGRLPVLSQASGQVKSVYVKNGDMVYAGQKILSITLDPVASQKNASNWAGYLSSQNSLKSAQAKLNSLQSALFKANQAFINDKGVPLPTDSQKTDPKYIEENADWLAAEADYQNQQGVIAAAQASVNSAWLNYQQSSPDLVAPAAGILQDLTYVPGMLISSSVSSSGITQSQAVASIVTDFTPTVAINLSEVDVNRVQEGNKATLTFDALPDKTATGKIIGINKTGVVTSGVTNYPATVQLDTGFNEILPNMSSSANIIISAKDNVLLVPSEAVQTERGRSFVRLLRGGREAKIFIETGLSSDTQTEIVSGLSENDIVITGTLSATVPAGQSPFSTFRFGGGSGGSARQGGR